MKLSELRPCDGCGEKLVPMFFHIEVGRQWVKQDAVNQVLGTMQILSGNLHLAETMAPVDEVTEQVDFKELLLCQSCFIDRLGQLYFNE